MKAALDVHYENEKAFAACVVFNHWLDSEPTETYQAVVPVPSQYRAGSFYERELPCLLSVLSKTEYRCSTIIIDGYVHLNKSLGKGLGTHLYKSLPYPAVVIGVAKSPLKVADCFVPIFRGRSKRPLYISSIGCKVEKAAKSILSMHGPYRIPTLLMQANQHSRSSAASGYNQ
jgi:deoxyribonuclease V